MYNSYKFDFLDKLLSLTLFDGIISNVTVINFFMFFSAYCRNSRHCDNQLAERYAALYHVPIFISKYFKIYIRYISKPV